MTSMFYFVALSTTRCTEGKHRGAFCMHTSKEEELFVATTARNLGRSIEFSRELVGSAPVDRNAPELVSARINCQRRAFPKSDLLRDGALSPRGAASVDH